MEAASSFSLASGLIARRNRNGLPSASICARGTVQVSRPGSVSGEGLAAAPATGGGTAGTSGGAAGASATAAIPFTFSTTSLLPGAPRGAPRNGLPTGPSGPRDGKTGSAPSGEPARNLGPCASHRAAADPSRPPRFLAAAAGSAVPAGATPRGLAPVRPPRALSGPAGRPSLWGPPGLRRHSGPLLVRTTEGLAVSGKRKPGHEDPLDRPYQ